MHCVAYHIVAQLCKYMSTQCGPAVQCGLVSGNTVTYAVISIIHIYCHSCQVEIIYFITTLFGMGFFQMIEMFCKFTHVWKDKWMMPLEDLIMDRL